MSHWWGVFHIFTRPRVQGIYCFIVTFLKDGSKNVCSSFTVRMHWIINCINWIVCSCGFSHCMHRGCPMSYSWYLLCNFLIFFLMLAFLHVSSSAEARVIFSWEALAVKCFGEDQNDWIIESNNNCNTACSMCVVVLKGWTSSRWKWLHDSSMDIMLLLICACWENFTSLL